MSGEENTELREFFSREFERLRADVAQEVGGLREEVAGLRSDTSDMRTELTEVHDELHSFEGHVARHFKRVDERFDSLDGQLRAGAMERQQLREDMRKVAEGVVTNGQRIDRLSAEMRDF